MIRNNIHGIIIIAIVSAAFTLVSGPIDAADYKIHHNPKQYVLDKFQSHGLVLLGTRHKREPILQFISNLIPVLYDAGVTHIGLEISLDHQDKIDHFIETGTGLKGIKIHPQIDRPGYRDLLKHIQSLDKDKRSDVVAIDLPKSQYGQMSRDEYMVESIVGIFGNHPGAKIIVVVGNNHVLKKLDWQVHVPSKTESIRSYLSEVFLEISAFSIGQLIDENPSECDFTRRLSHMNGSVAMDCDNSFRGWKIGITSALAIKPTESYDLVDGVIVY
jgi:hypothetical protein